MGVLDRVREEYPTLAFLLNDKEVGPLLRDAVDPNKGFSPTTFQSKLMQTNWFKQKSLTGRQYTVMRETDPGEFRRNVSNYRLATRQAARQLGVNMTNNELTWIAHAGFKNGWDPTDPRIAQAVSRIARKNPKRLNSGAIRANQRLARATSTGQFFMNMSSRESRNWGIKIALGNRTPEDLQAHLASRAMSKYPHLRKRLKAGDTPADIFSGHINVIAEELELDPHRVAANMWRGGNKWNPVMSIHDKKMGRAREMTLHETRTYARKDPRFWKTTQGRQMDAGMANHLLKVFGRRK